MYKEINSKISNKYQNSKIYKYEGRPRSKFS